MRECGELYRCSGAGNEVSIGMHASLLARLGICNGGERGSIGCDPIECRSTSK